VWPVGVKIVDQASMPMVSLLLCVFGLVLMKLRWVRMFMLDRLGAAAPRRFAKRRGARFCVSPFIKL
jgi:hypothetical protein